MVGGGWLVVGGWWWVVAVGDDHRDVTYQGRPREATGGHGRPRESTEVILEATDASSRAQI